MGGLDPQELVLVCAMCRRQFPSGIQAKGRALEELDLSGRVHECPYCGFTAAYNDTDYTRKGE